MDNIKEKLAEFYDFQVPEYVKGAGKTYLILNFGHERDGSIKPRKITLKDVVRYYATQADNIVSGCRTIANFTSDWRYINSIAKECLEWFKFVNIDRLRKEARRLGLEPRF